MLKDKTNLRVTNRERKYLERQRLEQNKLITWLMFEGSAHKLTDGRAQVFARLL